MTENGAEEVWRIPIDRSQAPAREPGPIDLRRNFLQAAYSGIPTFMGVPVCLDQEDNGSLWVTASFEISARCVNAHPSGFTMNA